MDRCISYQIARKVGTPLFKNHFKPKIIGMENIPKDGPVLLCGNHLHVWDQFPVICSTKRTTHWMAKKEYFDSKMGILFKMSGAICVDRFGDPAESKEEAINILKREGVVGLFPEGTRNGLKKEKIHLLYEKIDGKISFNEFSNILISNKTLLSQINFLDKLLENKSISLDEYKKYILNVRESLQILNKKNIIDKTEYDNSLLLDFKYGAVSMAEKTDAKVVPFAVTGDYIKNSNNLMVRFGEPFKVDSSLDSANSKLRSKVLTLVKENLKNTIN